MASSSGLTQTHLSKVELGRTDPRLGTLQDIARALKLELVLVPTELLATVRAVIDPASPIDGSALFEATGE